MTGARPFLIGLTGSIGMGKTTTAEMFRDLGIPVWDADETVHRLYAAGGAAVTGIGAICPQAVRDGAIDRTVLSAHIARDAGLLQRVEAVVHPLVADDRASFIQAQTSDIIVLDIPLLFENGLQDRFDIVALVSAPADLQRERVMQRPGMTAERFKLLLSRQMPDHLKRGLADVIIPTETMDGARDAVAAIVSRIRNGAENA